MNKNPFLPPPSTSYTHPPLPPGPPPSQPPHDYNYWAPQSQSHPSSSSTYNPQWNPPQPPRAPPPDQNHLYANYGYGPHWQRQQQQQAASQYQPAVAAPQPAYNPYQPTVGYGQPYAPPVPPPPPPYAAPQPPTAPGQQQHYYPPTPQGPSAQPSRLHHSPPHSLPPAKRQRFDGPSQPRQPQFPSQPPGTSHGNRSGSGNNGSRNSGSMRGGMGANRAGGRTGGTNPNKGGLPNKNSRTGGSFSGPNRGGTPNAGLRHGSRNNLNANNRRSGGSFTNGMGGGSFRNRQQKGGRHDGALGGGVTFGSRHGPMNSSHGSLGGKKDENRRTLTDFKLLALEIPELHWLWGNLPGETATASEAKTGDDAPGPSSAVVKTEQDENGDAVSLSNADGEPDSSQAGGAEDKASSLPSDPKPLSRHDTVVIKPDLAPPSRMRIYFHTPISADDSHPPATSEGTSDARKGKRKKIEDDDGDIEEGRAPPPPPQHSDDRSSVAASVISEGDWLMASLAQDRGSHDDEHHEDVDRGESASEPQVPRPEQADLESIKEKVEVGGEPQCPERGPSPDKAPSEHSGPLSEELQDKGENNQRTDGVEGNHEAECPETQPTTLDSQFSASGETTLVDIDSHSHSIQEDYHNIERDQGEEAEHDDDDARSVKTEPATPPLCHPDLPVYGPILPDHKTERVPSANRLSISYAGGSRRLVIDSEVVESMKIFRKEGRIEVTLTISKDGEEDIKGILVENLSDITKSYSAVHALTNVAYEADATVPPFMKVSSYPSPLLLVVYLDTVRPLSEPKWVKSGDIVDWLKSIFGRMFWVSGDAAQGWEKKITVADPDPPPTIGNVLDGWAINSPVGVKGERERFLKTHMTEIDNIMEILLRLVRGERATPFSNNSSLQLTNLTGPLLAALNPASAHASQQTHVSLAVLATFRLVVEFAKSKGDKGVKEAEDKMGEIIRCLPSHLIYKSLDGIFKEWRADKKGGR